jgi:hypothetical protein
MPAVPAQLSVDADLRFDFDGHSASLSANGSGDMFLTCADPQAVLAQLTSATLPAGVGLRDGARALGAAADGLHRAGLRLVFTGPQGDVVSLGRAQDSVVGRVMTGSSHVQLGARRALAPIAYARIAPSLRRPRFALCAVVLVALVSRYWRRSVPR